MNTATLHAAPGARVRQAAADGDDASRTRVMLWQYLRIYLAIMIPMAIVMVATVSLYDLVTELAFRDQVRMGMQQRYSYARDELMKLPVETWPATVEAARRLYPNGIQMETEAALMKSVTLPPQERAHLDAGDAAIATLHDGGDYAMQRLPGTPYVIGNRMTMTASSSLANYVWLLVVTALAAAPVLWFWFRPFWRDVERLSALTEQIGTGNFAVDGPPVRSSAMRPFAVAINRMAGRIHELLEAQRRLTSSVAHELTTPITQLVFALELVKSSTDMRAAAVLIAGMEEDLKELDSLVAELLEYARLEHSAKFEPEEVSLARLMEHAVHGAEHYPLHGKSIVLVPSRDDGPVRCDAHQMARAMANLLRNALRYATSRVQLSSERADGRTWIHVDDDGPGIPDDARARLFEPFARLDDSRTRDTGGHGLGLAIVQQVAKLHGGTARITGSPLGGARVSVGW